VSQQVSDYGQVMSQAYDLAPADSNDYVLWGPAAENPRIASAKMLPDGVVASREMLPAIVTATMLPPRPRRGYGHQDDTLGAG
jgi:hypothetical protein